MTTPNKSLNTPANNTFVGNWDVPVNANWTAIDTALGGNTSINVTGASGTVVLTSTQYTPAFLLFSGTLSANVIYQVPSGVGGSWSAYNNTGGAYTLTINSGGAGTSVALTQGSRQQIGSDGTNIFPTTTPGTQTNIAQTFTATQTFNGSSSTFASVLLNAAEMVNIVGAAPSGAQIYYVNSGAVQYYTTSAANNWTISFYFSAGTTLNTALGVGQSVTVAMITTQGATPYYNTAVGVDGTSTGVTTYWQGGTAPTTGNASGLDVYQYTIIKTSVAPTYIVLASLTQY
jgi:hypothetical protein